MGPDEIYRVGLLMLNEISLQTKALTTIQALPINAKISNFRQALDEAYLLSHQAKLRSLCKEILSLAKSIN